MSKTSRAPTAKKPMSVNDMLRELAAGLRHVIEETDTSYLERDPEEAFVDLANRLVVRLQDKLTVVPTPSRAEKTQLDNAAAAGRIFEILTQWMRECPGCTYRIKTSASGKFQIAATTAEGTKVFFGGTAQDVHAQLAQTVHFNEGKL